jgi:hypothetical protein
MFSRLLVCLLLVGLGLGGCASPEKKKKKAADAERAKENKKKTTMPDVSNDTSFQAFVGHLRTAVAKRDRVEIASLFAPNFGYRWDEAPPGETPFDYWDQNNSWSELEALLNSRFVPNESYMVAPAKFVTDSDYRGYRVGIRLVGGSWRLAYFITGEELVPL